MNETNLQVGNETRNLLTALAEALASRFIELFMPLLACIGGFVLGTLIYKAPTTQQLYMLGIYGVLIVLPTFIWKAFK
jgi:hypothetical protein